MRVTSNFIMRYGLIHTYIHTYVHTGVYARTNEWTHALTQMTTYKRTLDGCINADKPRAHSLVFATMQARTRTLAH